ncbi:immunoglobulin I-set domain protein, partial [Cooperia oncophora]
ARPPDAPEFTGKFQSTTIYEGDSVKLFCRATGDKITYKWFKDNEELSSTPPYRIENKGNETTLFIENATLAEGGWYRCDAINKHGTTRFTVVWLLNGKPIVLSSRVTTINEKGLAILEINPVTVFDQGEYTVVLVNPLGEARSSVVLNVMGHTTVDQPTLGNSFGTAYQSRSTRAPPGIQLDLPNFHSDLRSHELFEGQPIHLEAKLTPLNDPNLVVVWYLNGRELMKS